MSGRPLRHIVVQWPGFGPYHLARLGAARRLATELGHRVSGLETASSDARYDWGVSKVIREESGVRTVFQGEVFESLEPEETRLRIMEALDDLDPDVVAITSYSFPDSRACLEWCRTRRRGAVLMSATKEDDAYRVWWREWVKKRLVSQYDAALVGGTAQSLYAQRLGMESRVVFTGYNVVDNAYFSEAAARERQTTSGLPGLESGQPFFLAVGRLIQRKNLIVLLEAYDTYRTSASAPWRLVIVGDGPVRSRLREYVAANAIRGVVFAGRRRYDEIPSYYARAGAFVHPASLDQWGLVVNEAMASGIPVLVSTGAGCTRDLVIDGVNGFRFEPADGERLEELLRVISTDDALRTQMGIAAQSHIRRFSVEAFGRGLFRASDAAALHSDRDLSITVRFILRILRFAARSASSFHTVEA